MAQRPYMFVCLHERGSKIAFLLFAFNNNLRTSVCRKEQPSPINWKIRILKNKINNSFSSSKQIIDATKQTKFIHWRTGASYDEWEKGKNWNLEFIDKIKFKMIYNKFSIADHSSSIPSVRRRTWTQSGKCFGIIFELSTLLASSRSRNKHTNIENWSLLLLFGPFLVHITLNYLKTFRLIFCLASSDGAVNSSFCVLHLLVKMTLVKFSLRHPIFVLSGFVRSASNLRLPKKTICVESHSAIGRN